MSDDAPAEQEQPKQEEPKLTVWNLVEKLKLAAINEILLKSAKAGAEGGEAAEGGEGEGEGAKGGANLSLKDVLTVLHPESKESLLMWATLWKKYFLVENIVKYGKAGRMCYAFQNEKC